MSYILIKPDVWVVGSGEAGLSYWMDCHIYLLRTADGDIIIDAGSGIDTDKLIDTISGLSQHPGESIKYLWLTHCHGDHAGGVFRLTEKFPQIKVITSEHEAKMLSCGTDDELGLTQAKYAGTYPPNFFIPHYHTGHIVAHGQQWFLGQHKITSWITPGHTAGSVCFEVQSPYGNYLFSGDTLFWGGLVQLLNTPDSDLAAYRKSVLDILAALKPNALFPGHGMWVMEDAFLHIEKCVHYFKKSGPPPMPAFVEKIKKDKR